MKKRYILLMGLVAVLAFSVMAFANTSVSQTSTLNGTVSSKNLVTKGSLVKEGQVLLLVESIAGEVPAARATVDGRVSEVLVKPGDKIKSGQVVVKIDVSK